MHSWKLDHKYGCAKITVEKYWCCAKVKIIFWMIFEWIFSSRSSECRAIIPYLTPAEQQYFFIFDGSIFSCRLVIFHLHTFWTRWFSFKKTFHIFFCLIYKRFFAPKFRSPNFTSWKIKVKIVTSKVTVWAKGIIF